jgi:hypothetical protein
MRVRWPLCAMLAVLGISYAAYPYLTLYRLGQAIRAGDARTLQGLVDWPSVREGIKEDICDLVIDAPADAKGGSQLPPFGASFVRGIAASEIDQAVTPEALVAAVQAPALPKAAPQRGADVAVDWAFFASPTVFDVNLRVPGQAQPVRLELELHHARSQTRRTCQRA